MKESEVRSPELRVRGLKSGVQSPRPALNLIQSSESRVFDPKDEPETRHEQRLAVGTDEINQKPETVLAFLLLIFCLPLSPDVFAQTAESLNPHGPLNVACQDCHTSDAWRPIRVDLAFDHNTQTEYQLAGAHEITPCRGCHLELRLDQPKLEGDPCGLCHVDVHQGRFIESCDTCHGMDTFEEVNGDEMHNLTAFPLTGAHRDVVCQSCHVDDQDGGYTPLDTDCASCHAVTRENAPGHVDRNFPSECQLCHTTYTWTDGQFAHAVVSQGFDLVGAHAAAECSSCHSPVNLEPIFQPADQNDCFTCHEPAYERIHAGSGFPTTCLTCHNTTTWQGATFVHATVANGFQLVGAHAALSCGSCHNTAAGFEPLFTPASQTDCFTCHEQDYEREHGGSNFPTTCLNCHNVNSWN